MERKDPRKWKSNSSQKVWGLLRCKNDLCRRIHNRDKNSALNMLKIIKSVIEEGSRPLKYIRNKTIHSETNSVSI